MSKTNETEFLKKVRMIFSERRKSSIKTSSNLISDFELEEIEPLLKIEWEKVTLSEIERVSINFLSVDNFKYYLPSVIQLSITEDDAYLLAVETIIYYLDRPPSKTNWDDGFIEKWVGFTIAEYKVIQEWLYIINQMRNDYDIESIFRCIDTIDLLIQEIKQ